MGEAMLSAILERKLSLPRNVYVSEIKESRRRELTRKYGVPVTADNRQAAGNGDVIILAVKPQNLPEITAELGGHIRPEQLVLSIIAGASLPTLCQGLRHQAVARAMPNTPARIGEGISVWTATPAVSEHQKALAKDIIGTMGKEIYVAGEKYLDMATAVSGSGPAYFFYFAEALTEAARGIGIPDTMAGELVLQTMLGSAHLIPKSGNTPTELRKMVTSPGGTTEAALRQLEAGGFAELVRQAVTAAYHRAKELGK